MMASHTDGPAPLFRPLPLTKTQFSYYVEALGLPTTANIVCEQLGPLGHMNPGLADCVWNILGLVVDPTPTPPSYPFLRLSMASGPVEQVQVWLWQICLLGAPMWAELHWHPARGANVNFVNLSADASTRRQQLTGLDRAVKLTMSASQRGRPLYSGSTGGETHEELLVKIIEIVRASWQQGIRPTQSVVLKFLSDKSAKAKLDERSLRRIIAGQTGLTWDLFIEKNRPR